MDQLDDKRLMLYLYAQHEDGDVMRTAFRTRQTKDLDAVTEHEAFIMDQLKDEMELNSLGSYVPDGRFCAYEDMETQRPYKWSEQFRYIDHLEKSPDIPRLLHFNLRELAFAKECGWNGETIKDLKDFLHDIYVRRPDELRAYHEYHRWKEKDYNDCEITAVKTNEGTILFDNSGYGRRAEQTYLQFMAQHYFDADFKEKTGYIHRYHFITGDPELIKLAREGHKAQDREYHFDRFYNLNHELFRDDVIPSGVQPHTEFYLKTDFDEYQRFLDNVEADMDPYMKDIRFLTYTAEYGLGSSRLDEFIRNDNPSSLPAFEGIIKRINYSNALNDTTHPVRKALDEEAKQIARRILGDRYQARGYVTEQRPTVKQPKVAKEKKHTPKP